MKRTFIPLALMAMFTSCQDTTMDIQQTEATSIPPRLYEDVSYPLAGAIPIVSSRGSSDFNEDWEHFNEIPLPGGGTLDTPWGNSGYINLPSNVRFDIKKEDGWKLISHTFNRNPANMDKAYILVFFNQRTGALKYFRHFNGVQSNSDAFWEIAFEQPQAWMNATTEVAIPFCHQFLNDRSYKWMTNIDNWEETSTAKEGWTYFEIPSLAYDPNASRKQGLKAGANSKLSGDISLETITTGTIEGSIISHGSKNPLASFQGALADAAGDKAVAWSQKKLNRMITNEKWMAAISKGVKGLVELGVNKIASTFIGGLFSKNTTNVYDVRLQTRSESSTLGNITFKTYSGIPTFIMDLGKDSTKIELGIWNLAENPTVYIHPVGVLSNMPNGIQSDENEYAFCATGRYKYDLRINPDIQKYITKSWVEIEPVKYIGDANASAIPKLLDGISLDCGSLATTGVGSVSHIWENAPALATFTGTDNKRVTLIDYNLNGNCTYWNLWSKYGHGPNTGENYIYKYIYAPTNNDIIRGGKFAYNISQIFVKVSLYIETNFEGKTETTISTRTYLPKIEWDPIEVAKYRGHSMMSLQTAAANDPILSKIDKRVKENLRPSIILSDKGDKSVAFEKSDEPESEETTTNNQLTI